VSTHTWMKIAKSKGVADIGPLEEQLKEARSELAMAKHVANCQRVFLQEENEKLRLQLQELRKERGTSSRTPQQNNKAKRNCKRSWGANPHLQERELQAQIEIQALKQQLQAKRGTIGLHGQLGHGCSTMQTAGQILWPVPKDQWLQFQINTLAQRGISQIQDPQQFTELCNTSSSEDKAKLIRVLPP
jgi:regulator of replication initiation timing